MSGYIIFLRVETTTDAMANAMAVEAVDNLVALIPELDPTSTQVADEEQQNRRSWVFCAQWLDVDQRCLRVSGHPGPCSPTWPIQ